MKDKETPLKLVRLWNKMDSEAYAALDRCRAAKDCGEVYWPDYCKLPVNVAFTYLVTSRGMSNIDAAAVASELTACWSWRQNKIVYSFDRDLAEALSGQAEDMSDSDVLPSDLLLHLPYPIIYIKADILEETDGFFFWVDFDVNREAPELRIQWVLKSMEYSVPQVLHIIPGKTLKECIMDTVQTTQENMDLDIKTSEAGVEIARVVLSALQLILYLLADNADVEEMPPPVQLEQVPKRTTVTKESKKSNMDKASNVKAYSVGVRIGAAFRKAGQYKKSTSEGGIGSVKRPHTRRGHWHHYWTGPMNGERELVLKWTPPTIIHPEAGLEDNVVVFPVRK